MRHFKNRNAELHPIRSYPRLCDEQKRFESWFSDVAAYDLLQFWEKYFLYHKIYLVVWYYKTRRISEIGLTEYHHMIIKKATLLWHKSLFFLIRKIN